jgi:hypothetical protein
MRLGGQPRRRRGTVDRPYSALNLRMILASVGLVGWIVLAVLAFLGGYPVVGWFLVAAALLAVVDLVVIQVRRRARSRSDGGGHSLFE